MPTLPGPIPYTLRVGVTGHRELADPVGIEQAVTALLQHIQTTLVSAAEYPRGPCGPRRAPVQRLDALLTHVARSVWWTLPLGRRRIPAAQRTPIEWVAISPLARGADRIVARAILARPDAQLRVIAPLALDDYRMDFTTPEDLAEFEALLFRDPSPTFPEATDENSAESRSAHYLKAGFNVADACEILIAVWNGQSTGGYGGTADVIRYAVGQRRMVLWIDANSPARPVRQIVSARADTAILATDQEFGYSYLPLPTTAERFSRNFHRLAAYNRDAAYNARECQKTLDREVRDLRACADTSGLAERLLTPALTHWIPEYARADQLAQRYQAMYVRAAKLVYGLATLAVTIVVAQVLFFPNDAWLVVFEIAAMTLAVLFLRVSWHEAWHEKWLRDRHLAERLRIAMFATLIPRSAHPPGMTPEYALPFYRGPETWVLEACDRITRSAAGTTLTDTTTDTPASMEVMKRFLVDAWIANQAAWHARNSNCKRTTANHVARSGVALFVTTLIMAVWHWTDSGHAEQSNWMGLVATALAITLPAWASTLHAINTLLERERIAARSLQMAAVLHRLAQQAEHATTWEELAACVSRAEEIMATESHEWWVSLSFRDLVLPA